VPDPQDPATYARSKLDWSELESDRGRRMLAVYRELARLRREEADLTDPSFAHVACRADEAARFLTMQRGSLLVLVNFGDQPMAAEIGADELLFETESGVDLAGGVLRLPGHAGALVRPAESAEAS
jgi:maltooligosyltrehalose trehalohydrolase